MFRHNLLYNTVKVFQMFKILIIPILITFVTILILSIVFILCY